MLGTLEDIAGILDKNRETIMGAGVVIALRTNT